MFNLTFKAEKLLIDLELRDKITLVVGDSGIGKTYLIGQLLMLADSTDLIESSSLPITDVSAITIDRFSTNKGVAGLIRNVDDYKVLIIDEFNSLIKRKDFNLVLDAINEAIDVYFILITRDFPNLPYTDNNISTISILDSHIKLSYIFDRGVRGYIEAGVKLNYKNNSFVSDNIK